MQLGFAGFTSALMDDAEPGQATLPTYHTAANVLEKKNGSGWALAGWTVARTILIAPPLIAVGIPWKKAFAGAVLASLLISSLTLFRIAKAGPMTPLGSTRRRQLAASRTRRR